MKLKGKRVLVVGAGRSGIAAARFLAAKGAAVTLTDIKPEPELAPVTAFGVETCFGAYPEVAGYDLLVVSPGVPLTEAPVVEARTRGIEVIGELELAYRFARAPIVAVTGTNGKTTTTALTGEIFRAAGKRTLVAGNIGVPLVAAVEDYGPEDVIVAEVSSFQLETAVFFRPRVAVILNVTPDHLDRHRTLAEYAAAKARIFARQTAEDTTVLNADDPVVAAMAAASRARVLFFSRKHNLKRGVFIQQGRAVVQQNGQLVEVCDAGTIRIPGTHNLENALAATAAATALGVPVPVIGKVLQEFPGVAHRLEFVAEIGGVRYVNDSKGTNPDAAIKALEAYPQPVVLIAGGRNKGSDFSGFAAKMKQKVRALVVLGESAGEIAAAAHAAGIEPVFKAASLEEAVYVARDAARPGDVVLLSPACASWDMFKNYEERGELFKKTVREIAGRKNAVPG
ncbi:MAG: UDP-N-acetylmuramoyl-L-alanine--D-glutamate ligase [Bacillota bacterium]